MRTTIRLDDVLLRQAKSRAAELGRSLNDFIADAVRASLAARGRKKAGVALPVFSGRGLQPGIDLDDGAALLDIMEPGPLAYADPTRKVAERDDVYGTKRGNRR